MQTLKFKPQPTVYVFRCRQSSKRTSRETEAHFSRVKRSRLSVVISRFRFILFFWLTAGKNPIVSWALNFRVRMLLKTAIKLITLPVFVSTGRILFHSGKEMQITVEGGICGKFRNCEHSSIGTIISAHISPHIITFHFFFETLLLLFLKTRFTTDRVLRAQLLMPLRVLQHLYIYKENIFI